MLKSQQRYDAPLPAQVAFWNEWLRESREQVIGQVSMDQALVISSWLQRIGRRDLNIIDVGCGAGWLCQELIRYGQVTGTDLAHEVVARAAQRTPSARFLAGDFMTLDFGSEPFDVVTCLEVLSHVADQRAFVSKIADILKPGGYLLLATQNRPALERNDIPPSGPGQIRHWVDRHELSTLLTERFEIHELRSVTPLFNRGYLRYLNSNKLRSTLTSVGLGTVNRFVTEHAEKAWLGWTLMALAGKRA
jgi:2-polyprenyl-3-methyl-5-hydroxy-6-metoxy-1,4-benzoquinol methylase